MHWVCSIRYFLLHRFLTAGLLAFLFVFQILKAHASPSVQTKLLSGALHPYGDTHAYSAGIEMRLDKNWITYWKTAGEGGYAPRFDWHQSENVEQVIVNWPVPLYFNKGGHTFYGYQDYVILPVLVIPKIADKPVNLHLKMDYAVCNLQCVPLQAEFSKQFLSSPPPAFEAALVDGAFQRLPQLIALKELSKAPIDAYPASITLDHYADKPALLIAIEAPFSVPLENIFLHDPGHHFSVLHRVENKPNHFYAHVLSPPAPSALRDSSITLRTAQGSIEIHALFP